VLDETGVESLVQMIQSGLPVFLMIPGAVVLALAELCESCGTANVAVRNRCRSDQPYQASGDQDEDGALHYR